MVIMSSYILISEPYAPQTPNGDLKMYPALEAEWLKIRFDAINTLHIAPFNAVLVGGKYMFGRGPTCTATNPAGDLNDRLEWVIKRARSMNPNIKLIAEQMHNDGDYSVLSGGNYHDYTDSVANFMTMYLHKTLDSLDGVKGAIPAHFDGYGLDYEAGGLDDQHKLGSGNL